MNAIRIGAVLVIAAPLWGSYSYYLTDNLTSVNPVNWAPVGSLVPGSAGLGATDAAGGSLISRLPVPDGTGEGEVRITVRLGASGGTFTEFLQATLDARTGGNGGGSYLAFEMQNPQFDASGHCGATFVVLQSVAGVTSVLASFPHSCRDGMSMRMAIHGTLLVVWPDQATPMEMTVSASGVGLPGIGSYGTPSGNAISEVQLGMLDRTAPTAIDPNSIGLSAFRNHIDVQWKPVADDAAGIGLAGYWVFRDGQYLGRTTATMFQDFTVNPGESHTYAVAPVDQHYNFAPPANLKVSTPAPQTGPASGNLPKRPKLPGGPN